MLRYECITWSHIRVLPGPTLAANITFLVCAALFRKHRDASFRSQVTLPILSIFPERLEVRLDRLFSVPFSDLTCEALASRTASTKDLESSILVRTLTMRMKALVTIAITGTVLLLQSASCKRLRFHKTATCIDPPGKQRGLIYKPHVCRILNAAEYAVEIGPE